MKTKIYIPLKGENAEQVSPPFSSPLFTERNQPETASCCFWCSAFHAQGNEDART